MTELWSPTTLFLAQFMFEDIKLMSFMFFSCEQSMYRMNRMNGQGYREGRFPPLPDGMSLFKQ